MFFMDGHVHGLQARMQLAANRTFKYQVDYSAMAYHGRTLLKSSRMSITLCSFTEQSHVHWIFSLSLNFQGYLVKIET